MVTIYKAELLWKTVHELDKENGQSKQLHSIGGYELGYFPAYYPTLAAAVKSCANPIGYIGEIKKDFFNGGYLSLSVIENAEGYQDDKGTFLCDYEFLIEKHQISTITEDEINKFLTSKFKNQ